MADYAGNWLHPGGSLLCQLLALLGTPSSKFTSISAKQLSTRKFHYIKYYSCTWCLMSLKKTQVDEVQDYVIWMRVLDLLAVCLFWCILCISYPSDTWHPFWASQCTFSSFKINISELTIRSSSTVYSTANMNIPSKSENRGKGQMISSVAKNSYRVWEVGWGEGNVSWTGARNLHCGEKFFTF